MKYELMCNTKMCKIGSTKISFLEHYIDSKTIQKPPGKLGCIKNFTVPCNVWDMKKVFRSMQLVYLVCRQIRGYNCTINRPFKTESEMGWMEVKQRAFEDIKSTIYDCLKLSPPDYRKLFCLHTDASEIGTDAVIFQRCNDPHERRIIAKRPISSGRRRKSSQH